MLYRECSSCHTVLPHTENYFPRRWDSIEGYRLQGQCQECFNRLNGNGGHRGRKPKWLSDVEDSGIPVIRSAHRVSRCPRELLDDRVTLYANRASNGVPLTRRWGLLHGGRHMNRPGLGAKVVVVAPENPKLHGAMAFVKELREWGAVLGCERAATGEFRALWCEMVHPDDWFANGPAPPPPGQPRLPLNWKHHKNERSVGYTGNSCGNCGGIRLVRTGTCETCQECGQTSGGCS